MPEDADKVETIQAISVETGRTIWKYEQRAGKTSIVATGSGLLFTGDVNGRFRAFDQDAAKILWEGNLGHQSRVIPSPISRTANSTSPHQHGDFAGHQRSEPDDSGIAIALANEAKSHLRHHSPNANTYIAFFLNGSC